MREEEAEVGAMVTMDVGPGAERFGLDGPSLSEGPLAFLARSRRAAAKLDLEAEDDCGGADALEKFGVGGAIEEVLVVAGETDKLDLGGGLDTTDKPGGYMKGMAG